MKKMLFGLMLLGATSAMAQNQETTEIAPVDKYSVATNRFWSNWFVTAGGDYVSSYSDQELGLGLSKNPFKSFRRSWNGDITLGKWFTPVLGVRAKTQMMQLQCVDGRENPSFDMVNVNAQLLVNVRNLFWGYQPDRIWNISLYAGTGFYRNLDEKNTSYMYTAGMLNTFNVTKRLFINLDIYGNVAVTDLDRGVAHANTPKAKGFLGDKDRQLGVSLGLGVNLGKVGWSKTPDLEAINAMHKAQTDALNASLAEQQSENDKLKGLLAKRPETSTSTVTKEVAVTTPVSVFFNLNSSRIASKKDLVNVQALVDQLNGGKVEVYGYADSKTGSADYNKQLSERRAEAVAKELKKMGLKDEQIIIKPMGGVNELTPASYNRRVIVKVVK
ncbi:OmpA family protein [Bacteroides eggerthii]|jgi:outer membrane protein OmpA-like peptidoglycan-associated protein|uniref:OmpA family protein n=1 Tax=Bacteroides eggerthii TaxID=28111 RepID=A0ABT7U2X7_9BACE|nr:OmpA family protein [Bacteroides eggerthii]